MKETIRKRAYKDLRGTLIHEHAHAAVAFHFGGLGIVHVWRNPNGGTGERHFGGTCVLVSRLKRGGKRASIVLGLAGFLAEYQDAATPEQRDDAELAAESFAGAVAEAVISETDLALARDANAADFRRCLRLLGKLREQIRQAVEIDLQYGVDDDRWDQPAPHNVKTSEPIAKGKT